MALIKIQPDKQYSIVESRLRIAVPADLPEKMVPFYTFKDFQKTVEILERTRDWRFMDRIPQRLQFTGKPCCTQIALGLPGKPLQLRYEKSALQGDTDDIHNFDEHGDEHKRFYEEGLVDYVIIAHFWQPVLYFDKLQIEEEKAALNEETGFLSPENMPDRRTPAEKLKDAAGGGSIWVPSRMVAQRKDGRLRLG